MLFVVYLSTEVRVITPFSTFEWKKNQYLKEGWEMKKKTKIKRSYTMKKRGNTFHFDKKITYPFLPGRVLPIPGHVMLLLRVGSYKFYANFLEK